MAEGFQVARLIPVSGIANNQEAETRATSALLSVLTIVRDSSSALLTPLGASSARRALVEAFIETKFKMDGGTIVRPDGLVQVTYGASTWKAFVEVKTGDNCLEAEQLNHYLALAREQGIDAVITVSNEIAAGDRHPCADVKLRANSRVRLAHYSWTEVLAHAVRTKVHRGVDDIEQAWILGELIRYLEHPASGAMAFNDMGASWVEVRDQAREGTLRKGDAAVREIVGRWDQLLRFAALHLGSQTGAEVQHVVPRSHADPKVRAGYLIDSLSGSGTLDGVIRVPGAAGNVTVLADVRARRVSVSTDIAAPDDRGNKGRITWLVRQLGPDTPKSLVVEAWGKNARQPIAATLEQVREDKEILLDPDRRDLLRFRLVLRGEMGQNRKDGGRSPGFIQSVTGLLDDFYSSVLQQIVPWTPRAPQARPTKPTELVDEPIEGAEELEDAIDAARATAAEESGAAAPEEDRPAVASVATRHEEDHEDGEEEFVEAAAAPEAVVLPVDAADEGDQSREVAGGQDTAD